MAFKRKHKKDKGHEQALAKWLDDGQSVDSPQPEQGAPAQSQPANNRSAFSRPTTYNQAGRSVYDRPTAPDPRRQPVPTPAMPPQPAQQRPQTPPAPVYVPPTQPQAVPRPRSTSVPAYLPQEPSRQSQAAAPASTNVNINISLPQLKKPTLPKLPYKKIGIIAATIIILVVISLIAHAVIVAAVNRHKAEQAAHTLSLAKKVSAPTFTPLLPKGKSDSIGKTAAFDGSRDTYSYSDTFGGTPLIVSQQPIPATFDSVSAGIAKVAKSINATTPIVSKVGTAYLSTDSKSGAQTIVFANNGVLVFVQSSFNHSATDWKYYLDSLSQ